jgi:hypothetical protein
LSPTTAGGSNSQRIRSARSNHAALVAHCVTRTSSSTHTICTMWSEANAGARPDPARPLHTPHFVPHTQRMHGTCPCSRPQASTFWASIHAMVQILRGSTRASTPRRRAEQFTHHLAWALHPLFPLPLCSPAPRGALSTQCNGSLRSGTIWRLLPTG